MHSFHQPCKVVFILVVFTLVVFLSSSVTADLCASNEKNSEWQCNKWSPWSECHPDEDFDSTNTTNTNTTNTNTTNTNTTNSNTTGITIITAECGKERECLEGPSKGEYKWAVCKYSSGPECLSTPIEGQCSAYDYGSCGPTCIQCGCCVEPEDFEASLCWFDCLIFIKGVGPVLSISFNFCVFVCHNPPRLPPWQEARNYQSLIFRPHSMCIIFNRPGVDGAVIQSPSSTTN